MKHYIVVAARCIVIFIQDDATERKRLRVFFTIQNLIICWRIEGIIPIDNGYRKFVKPLKTCVNVQGADSFQSLFHVSIRNVSVLVIPKIKQVKAINLQI